MFFLIENNLYICSDAFPRKRVCAHIQGDLFKASLSYFEAIGKDLCPTIGNVFFAEPFFW